MSNKQDGLPQDDEIEQAQFSADWVGRISYWIFHYRKPLLILFILITILLGGMASQLRVQAAFTKMIPLKHPYMATFLEYQSDFGGANRILVALKNTKGEIYEKDFMEKLRKVTEEVFFIKGVERSSVTSLFSPNVRYNEVVEDGFRGGNIVAADFAGTQEQLRLVRENLLKSDWVGRIVSNDQTSAMVVATLMENDPETGRRLDLQQVAAEVDQHVALARGLDALAHHQGADVAAYLDHRLDEPPLERLLVDVAHQRHVEIHDLRANVDDAGEGGVAGAEIV